MIGKSHKLALCHRDRWRVEDMLKEQPDLLRKDPGRDMDLWRHLFAPDDLVRIGNAYWAACEAGFDSASRSDLQGTDELRTGLRSRARQVAVRRV